MPAPDVIDAIVEAAYTGQPGDGKEFVLPVGTSFRSGRERKAWSPSEMLMGAPDREERYYERRDCLTRIESEEHLTAWPDCG